MPASTPDLVASFVELERRRMEGSLAQDELTRWGGLRDQLELATGAVRPVGVERREAIRVTTCLQVQVSNDAARALARAHDLSEGGMFLQTNQPSRPGTPVSLELLDLPGGPLNLEGTVVWVRLEGEGVGTPGMGIRFRNLDEWDRTVLFELVEAELRAL